MRMFSTILAVAVISSLAVTQTWAQCQSNKATHNTLTISTASPAAPAEMDIVDTAVQADGFNTLVAAVKAAGLVEALKGEGPFTVFAPTDEAFAALPEGTVETLLKQENLGKLQAILKYHVVSGKVMAGDVLNALEVKTLQGSKAPVGLTIGGARIIKTDIKCSNGVIHVIDAVILPKN